MLRLRIIVPRDLTTAVVDGLRDAPGVAHLVHVPGAAAVPPGDLVTCDVARESANEIIEWLQDHGVHRRGAITAEALETVVSDAAARAEARAGGEGADALVWEEIEARVRADADLNASFLVFAAVAAVLAAIGILLDSPILVVGAMVVGPEYGPVAAACVAAVRRRGRAALEAGRTLAVGLAVAAVAALAGTGLFEVTGLAPDDHRLAERELTAFIAQPDGLAAVVAVLAGIVGMLALTEARSAALLGVLVSATTIPAVGYIGVATTYGDWDDVAGAALQLVVNVAGLLVAGVATLAVQDRLTARRAGLRAPGARR